MQKTFIKPFQIYARHRPISKIMQYTWSLTEGISEMIVKKM